MLTVARPQSKLSRRGFFMIARWTICGTLGCMAISLVYHWFAFRNIGEEALRQGMISATVLPTILAGPLFWYLTLKLRELASVNHQLAELASTDHLTKCLNRRALVAGAERLLEQGPAARGALLVIDADHFKSVNDAHGHHQGDRALVSIASLIRKHVRQVDLVGRVGGEEFAVLLGGIDCEQAANVAERIRRAVEITPLSVDGVAHPLTISIGCATYSGKTTFRDLFSLADRRLYDAKRLGRNRVVCDDAAVAIAGASLPSKKAG